MKLKKMFACAACAAMMTTVAFAEGGVYVNDEKLDEATVEQKDDMTFIPLRSICEKLGFEVNWKEESNTIEIVNLPLYITCSPEYDGYTFAKTAPQKLGSNPILINDRTYVPINFLTEILNAKYRLDNEELRVYYGDYSKTVTVISKDEEGILVDDPVIGEVVLKVSDDTVIQNEAGEPISEDEIVEGAELIVEYSDAMTMSLPPQTNAIKIQLIK